MGSKRDEIKNNGKAATGLVIGAVTLGAVGLARSGDKKRKINKKGLFVILIHKTYKSESYTNSRYVPIPSRTKMQARFAVLIKK